MLQTQSNEKSHDLGTLGENATPVYDDGWGYEMFKIVWVKVPHFFVKMRTNMPLSIWMGDSTRWPNLDKTWRPSKGCWEVCVNTLKTVGETKDT